MGHLRFGARDVTARSALGRVVLRRVLQHLLRAGDVPRSGSAAHPGCRPFLPLPRARRCVIAQL